MRSIEEGIASVMIATEPVIAPAASFSAMSAQLEAIDSAAARVLITPAPAGCDAMSGPATSALQVRQQRARGAPAMADRVLLGGVQLGHRAVPGEIVGDERRVIAEAAVAARDRGERARA